MVLGYVKVKIGMKMKLASELSWMVGRELCLG